MVTVSLYLIIFNSEWLQWSRNACIKLPVFPVFFLGHWENNFCTTSPMCCWNLEREKCCMQAPKHLVMMNHWNKWNCLSQKNSSKPNWYSPQILAWLDIDVIETFAGKGRRQARSSRSPRTFGYLPFFSVLNNPERDPYCSLVILAISSVPRQTAEITEPILGFFGVKYGCCHKNLGVLLQSVLRSWCPLTLPAFLQSLSQGTNSQSWSFHDILTF